jgi:hypothetical protein
MADDFDGVNEKLKRSHENIRNLESEITRFFQESKYPFVVDNNKKLIPEAIEYHQHRPIPPRFAVLAGEIVHHLRSCLDHIVWLFSESTYRESRDGKWIEFPILAARPSKEHLFTRYERKIKGLTNPVVRKLIEDLQPYNCRDPVDSLLFIIHKFDVIDKHRELVIVVSTGAIRLPIEVMDKFIRYKSGVPGSVPVDFKREFERDGEIVPEVALSEYGRAKTEPIVQGLSELQNYVVEIATTFYELRHVVPPSLTDSFTGS